MAGNERSMEGNRLKSTGRHLLVEYKSCNPQILNDRYSIETLMQNAAKASGTTIVTSVFHPFFPQGISGVVVIEESHLSIHTWPEYGYAAVDFFTCGDGIPERAHEVLKEGLGAEVSEVMFVSRGFLTNATSMEVRSHRTEDRNGHTIHMSTLHEVADPVMEKALVQNAAK
jgi:S-adenosylmethionine decarboxylase proenzyme